MPKLQRRDGCQIFLPTKHTADLNLELDEEGCHRSFVPPVRAFAAAVATVRFPSESVTNFLSTACDDLPILQELSGKYPYAP